MTYLERLYLAAIALLLSISTVVAGTISASDTVTISSGGGGPFNIMAVGDSITAGVFGGTGDHYLGYRCPLILTLAADGFNAVPVGSQSTGVTADCLDHFVGASGQTISQIQGFYDGDNAGTLGAKYLLLFAGTNDIDTSHSETPAVAFAAMKTFLNDIFASQPGVWVIVSTITPLVPTFDPPPNVPPYNTLLKTLPSLYPRVSVVDPWTPCWALIQNNGGNYLACLQNDGIHPGIYSTPEAQSGYGIITAAFRTEIERLERGVGICSQGPPPEAAAAGMNTLYLCADFSKNINSDCFGAPIATAMWYHNRDGILQGTDCSSLTWPDTDPVSGETVLGIHVNPLGTNGGNRQGLVGEYQNGSGSNPANLFKPPFYFEGTVRSETRHAAAPYPVNRDWISKPHHATWNSVWSWTSFASNPAGQTVTEIDLNENHSDVPGLQFGPGNCMWSYGGCGQGNTDFTPPRGNNEFSVSYSFSDFNPNTYHTFGQVLSKVTLPDAHCKGSLAQLQAYIAATYPGDQPAAGCLRMDGWIDHGTTVGNQPWGTIWSAASTDEYNTNSQWAIINGGIGCGGEDDQHCINQTVIQAVSGAGGQLELKLAPQFTNCNANSCQDGFDGTNNGHSYLMGIGGNVPDGSYDMRIDTAHVDTSSGFNDCGTGFRGNQPNCYWYVFFLNGGPVPFTSGYTNSGVMDPVYREDVYVKSFRVFVPP